MNPGATTATTIPSAGFADPPRDTQLAFRAVLDALSHPTRPFALTGPAEPPAALGGGLGAIALTLLDEETSVWLGPALASDGDVTAWLRFHTGVQITTDPATADFLLTDPASAPSLSTLRIGTEEAPHRSATVVLDVRGLTGGPRLHATGPGIDGSTSFDLPWSDPGFVDSWAANVALFPCGVDLLLLGEQGADGQQTDRQGVDRHQVVGLPRTTRIGAVERTDQQPEA